MLCSHSPAQKSPSPSQHAQLLGRGHCCSHQGICSSTLASCGSCVLAAVLAPGTREGICSCMGKWSAGLVGAQSPCPVWPQECGARVGRMWVYEAHGLGTTHRPPHGIQSLLATAAVDVRTSGCLWPVRAQPPGSTWLQPVPCGRKGWSQAVPPLSHRAHVQLPGLACHRGEAPCNGAGCLPLSLPPHAAYGTRLQVVLLPGRVLAAAHGGRDWGGQPAPLCARRCTSRRELCMQ